MLSDESEAGRIHTLSWPQVVHSWLRAFHCLNPALDVDIASPI